MTRCELCGMPLDNPGRTGYCSERCLHYDFFGVPALKQEWFLREMRQNQQLRSVPPDWSKPTVYPELSNRWRKEVTEALALLKIECDRLKSHG